MTVILNHCWIIFCAGGGIRTAAPQRCPTMQKSKLGAPPTGEMITVWGLQLSQSACQRDGDFLQDERGTTITAHNFLNTTNTRGKKRKNVVDEVAATIILQDYLDKRKSGLNK